MKVNNEKGSVLEYQGEKLAQPIEYTFEFQTFETLTEAKDSESWPSDAEILKFVNNKAKTAAKAAAYQVATKALKEAYEATPEFKRAGIVKAAIAAGMGQAEAEALAASII